MTQDTLTHPPGELEALEARFGLGIGAHLNASLEELPHDITERLRFAREQALARQRPAASSMTRPAAAPMVVGNADVTLALGGPEGREARGWMSWLGPLLPPLVLLLGLVAIDEWQWQQQIHEAAEIDSILLADDLPPVAYSDPGFAAYLKATAGR